ncbi:hypothetical protein Tco_1226305 [Tanacetum coccineum]
MYGNAAKLEKLKDAKLAWLLDKYYYRSQESVGCSSSHANLYLTEKELYQLHLDEEALRETLEEQAMGLHMHGRTKIRQKQAVKVVEDVGEDSDFNSGAWISASNYVLSTGGTVTGCLGDIDNFLEKEKLAQVVAIVKTCSPNALGDL